MWNYPLWFLVSFFVCKCVFDGIVEFSKGRKRCRYIQVIATLVCFALGLYLSSIRKEYVFFYPFRADIGITMVIFMLIGGYSKQYCDQMEAKPGLIQSTATVILLVINLTSFRYNTLVSVNSSDYGNPILFLAGAISGSGFVIFFCQMIRRISILENVLSWFGRNSLTIMCTHVIVMMFISKFLLVANRFVGISVFLLDYIKFLCCVLAMILVCWFIGKVKRIIPT